MSSKPFGKALGNIRHAINPYATSKIIWRLGRCGYIEFGKPLTRWQMRFLPVRWWVFVTRVRALFDQRYNRRLLQVLETVAYMADGKREQR